MIPTFQVDTLSDDEIQSMLSDDEIIGGKKDEKQEEVKLDTKVEPTKDKKVDAIPPKGPTLSPVQDLETLEEDDLENEDHQEPDKGQKPEDIKKDAPKTKETNKVDPKKDEPAVEINYKAAVDYLVAKGLFVDFEGREEAEYDEESYAQLLEAQADHKANQKFSEKINSLGDIGRKLVQFEDLNGNPRALFEVFKESVDIQNIDLDDVQGQETVIREYYTRAKKSPSWISKQINLLKEEGEEALRTEAEENKKLLLEVIEEESEEMMAVQQAQEERKKIAEQQYNQNLKRFIHSDNIPDREKRELEKFYFEYKHDVGNGQKANDFLLKFREIQEDPKKYYKFMKFLKNFDKFEDETKTANEVKKQVFDFVRKGQGESNKKTTTEPEFSGKTKIKNPFSI